MKGRFSTRPEHIASEKRTIIERGAAFLVKRVSRIGPESGAWAGEVIAARGAQGMRCLQGFIALAAKYPPETLNRAARQARAAGIMRLRPVRTLLQRGGEAPGATVEFMSEHPVIRPMAVYQQHLCMERSADDVNPSPDEIPQATPAVGAGGDAGDPAAGGGQFGA